MFANERASTIFLDTYRTQHSDYANLHIVRRLIVYFDSTSDVREILDGAKARFCAFAMKGPSEDEQYGVQIVSRRLGEDTGKDILLNVSGLIRDTHQHMAMVLRGADEPISSAS